MSIINVKQLDANQISLTINNINSELEGLGKYYSIMESGEFSKIIEKRFGIAYKRLSNFFIVPNSMIEVVDSHGNEVDIVYRFEVIVAKYRKSYMIELTSQEYFEYKWIKEIPCDLLLELPCRETYKELREFIDIMMPNSTSNADFLSNPASKSCYYKDIGWHKINEKYYYIHSRGAIGEEGCADEIGCSILKDYCINYDVDDTEDFERKAFEEMIDALKIGDFNSIIPIFSITLLSLIITPLKHAGISPDLLLWIDAETSSGKTELALLFGSIFNRGRNNFQEDIKKNMMMALDKPKDVINKFYEHRDCVFILDDVNRSKGLKIRENMKENIGLLTRIIGNRPTSGEKPSQALAIITGEFLDEIKSSISRYFYIEMDNFFTNEKRSEDLTYYQDNNIFLSNFIFFFIKWLAKKLNNGLVSNIKENIDRFRKRNVGRHKSRVIDTLFFMLKSQTLLRDYAFEQNFWDEQEVYAWQEATDNVFDHWVRILDKLVEDEVILFMECLKEAIMSDQLLIEYFIIGQLYWDPHRIQTFIKPSFSGIYIEKSGKQPEKLLINSTKLYEKVNLIKQNEDGKIKDYQSKQFSNKQLNKILAGKGVINTFLRYGNAGTNNYTRPYEYIERQYPAKFPKQNEMYENASEINPVSFMEERWVVEVVNNSTIEFNVNHWLVEPIIEAIRNKNFINPESYRYANAVPNYIKKT